MYCHSFLEKLKKSIGAWVFELLLSLTFSGAPNYIYDSDLSKGIIKS